MKNIIFILCCLTLVFCGFSFAGVEMEIRLKNGNRLTVTEFFYKDNAVEGNYFNGKIKIPWAEVVSLKFSGEYFVFLNNDTRMVCKGGQRPLKDGFLEVVVDDGDTVVLKKEAIKVIETRKQYQAYLAEAAAEQKRQNNIASYWVGSTDIGYRAQSGNTEDSKLNYLLKGKRTSKFDVFHIEVSGVQGRTDQKETANAGKLKTRFDLKLNEKSFYFLLSSLEYDTVKKIDLRSVLGLGAGWTFWDKPEKKLTISVGATHDKEARDDNTKKSTLTGLLSADWKYGLFGKSYLEGDLSVYPDFKKFTENLKFDMRISFVNPITKKASLKLTLVEKYNHSVLPGVKKLDTQLLTGLSYKF